MKSISSPKLISLLALTALLVVSCAQRQIGDSSTAAQSTPPQGSADTDFSSSSSSSGGGSSSSGSSSSSSSSGSSSTGTPPFTFRVGTVGYNSTQVQLNTGKVLKIAFAPGVQDQAVAGTNFTPQYGHLGVYLTVGGTTVPTDMTSNGLSDGYAGTSRPIDFSHAMNTACTGSTDATCRASVTVTVSKPNYDYWCLNFNQYCSWTHVYETHPWNGNLIVQTDDTDSL